MTNKAIIGQVSSGNSAEKGKIFHTFKIVVAALNNYSYQLFSIRHDAIFLYPVKIVWLSRSQEVADAQGLLDKMAEIFTHDTTTKIISSILAQVEGEKPQAEEEKPEEKDEDDSPTLL